MVYVWVGENNSETVHLLLAERLEKLDYSGSVLRKLRAATGGLDFRRPVWLSGDLSKVSV